MVVLLLSTVTQDGSCGGDEEGRRWCPCLFLAVAYVFFCFCSSSFSLSLLLSISVPNSFLPSDGGATIVDGDSRRFFWFVSSLYISLLVSFFLCKLPSTFDRSPYVFSSARL